MRWMRTVAAAILTVSSLLLVAGGCVGSMVLLGQAMQQEERPNAALITLAVTIAVASLLFLAARAVSKDESDQ